LAGFVLGFSLLALLHAPMLPQIFHRVAAKSDPAVVERAAPEWKSPIWSMLEIFRNVRELGLGAMVGLPSVIALTAIGVFSLGRRHPLFAAIFVPHVPLTLMFLLLLSFPIWPRYFFVDLGFIVLCATRGVFALSEYLTEAGGILNYPQLKGANLGVLVSGGAVLCSLFLLPANYRYPKQDFGGARDFVEASRRPGDTVASVGLASYAFSKYYAPEWQVVDTWDDVQKLRRTSGHTWLVCTSVLQLANNYPDVMSGLASEFDLVATFPGTLGDGTVFVYRSRPLSYPNS
jgi:hypothetical protein